MSKSPQQPAIRLTEHVRSFETQSYVLAAAFLNGIATFALADGAVLSGEPGAMQRELQHEAGMLTAIADRERLITGGEDGKVIQRKAGGGTETLADRKGKWIDALALGPAGATAWAAGKSVSARSARGIVKTIAANSTPQGLAFRPKGYQLAMAQNGGALLWMPDAEVPPERFDWKGSHLDVTWSPDARFLVTSMQENALHGWRVADKAHMRMTGYPAKTRSVSWSHDGNWLATSGADACIIWPFSAKDGPMGKAPRECGVRPARVSCVAFHPSALVIAIGYEDGWIILVRLTDASELLVRSGGDRDKITAMGWDTDGKRLVFGTAEGQAGVLTLP